MEKQLSLEELKNKILERFKDNKIKELIDIKDLVQKFDYNDLIKEY